MLEMIDDALINSRNFISYYDHWFLIMSVIKKWSNDHHMLPRSKDNSKKKISRLLVVDCLGLVYWSAVAIFTVEGQS